MPLRCAGENEYVHASVRRVVDVMICAKTGRLMLARPRPVRLVVVMLMLEVLPIVSSLKRVPNRA